MDNKELQPVSPQLPSEMSPQNIDVHMEQSGKGKQIGFVQHYEERKLTSVFLPINDDDDDDDTPEAQIDLDLNYYNLFVIADEMFKGKYFVVPKDHAIAVDRCTPEDLWELAYLTEECINIVKSFPAIFASTNHQFARTDDRHRAFFGIVRDVQVKEDGIWIYFIKYRKFAQQILNERKDAFGIGGTDFRNELDETHWAIKKVDVIEALNNNGCKIRLL